MANDTTRIIIDIESRLRNLERTLKGLDAVKKKLDAIGGIKPQSSQGTDRAVLAAQKLALQQQRLIVQTQELANRQERVRQTSERLALTQQRLTLAQQRSTAATSRQANAHVQFFKAVQRSAIDANKHVQFFRATEAALKKAPQMDSHVRAFRAIEKSAQDADAHVRAFRASEAFLRKSPQMDAHVQAFRSIEDVTRRANREQERLQRSVLTLDQTLGRIGGTLRNLGLGLVSLGSSLSVALTVPLTALGVLSARNAVTLDSLNRGLTAIVGSADEAGRQLSRLTNIAKLPGIGFQEAIQGSIRLQAVGFSAGVAERALIQFSNAVALTGGGREELARITVQLGQLSAKGKVLAQDLKPIIEAGPAVGRALLQAFGTVNSEDIQALGLSSQEFIEQLLNQLEKLPRAAAGLRNTFDNFSDAVFRASAAIGGAILPVLTRLIEVAEPIITKLADGFAKLPAPVQTLVVTFSALAAAAGPALFVIGQFATGIGGLISAFGRLHALGLLPTIASFRLLTQVMAGSASLAAGQVATTAAAAAGWGALGIAILGVVALAGGIALLLNQQKDAVKISKEQIAATDAQIATLKDQLKFTNSLEVGVKRTADEQDRLAQIYADLNTQAKVRLTAITDEEKRLAALREELEKILELRNEERLQQTAALAASLADTAAQIDANQRSRDSIAERVKVNTVLAQTIGETSKVTIEQSRQLERLGLSGAATAEQAIFDLNKENERLIRLQTELIKSSKELNGTAEEQANALRALGVQNIEQARQVLSLAKAIGVFKGNVEDALPALDRYISKTDEATKSTDRFNQSLSENERQLNKAGERADAAAKQRATTVASAAAVARETSVDFAGALKSLREMVQAVPELRRAVERESELTGKSLDELLRSTLEGAFKGRDKASSGTGLRNAREQLANALLEIGVAEADKQKSQLEASNERLLQANELSFRLQLRSYREYLETRALLTKENLDKEIEAEAVVAENARAAQARLQAAALKSGISETERVKRQAQAATQNEKAIRAEARLLELESERAAIAEGLAQELAAAAVQQIKDVRQLEIEFAELKGKIEDALNAATDERFRERLQDLAKTQDLLNKQLEKETKARRTDRAVQIKVAIDQNQRDIEAINNIITQERALNKLAGVNEFVRRVKEEQAELERQIAFEVEFRGLKEEDAIRKRLEGERRLADSLAFERDLIQSVIDKLDIAKAPVPQALLEFVRETNDAIRGLGELTFSEQFARVEKEFNRLNDERLRRIAEVERAVRERDIAEIEGMLIIRRINGEYEGDLQRQIDLLKAIAAQSNDTGLQKQAADLQQTAKDANSQLADFDRQLRSTSIDALRDGFTDFFTSLTDRTKTAREKLLDLVNSVAARIQQVIAENLSEKLIESLFGTGEGGAGGLLAAVQRVFGGGGEPAANTGTEAVSHGVEAVEHTAAATALTTGATVAGTTLIASMATAATAFASAVIAAGAAFASIVAGASGVQSLGGLGSALGAATGLFPAVPGGMYRVVEGGYPEAVITTDPKYAVRQVNILRELIQRTRGFGGRVPVPDFAMGGIVSRETVEANLLSSINRTPSFTPRLSDAQMETAAGATMMNLRITNQVDAQRIGHTYLSSEEGTRDVLNIISTNSNEVARRVPFRR